MYTGSSLWTLKNTEYTGGIHLGFVFKTQEELGEDTCVGFYLPKILPLVDATSGPVETSESVDTSIFANEISPPTSVDTANYVKAKYNGRANFSQPLISLGETAQLFFLNGDYKELRYLDSGNDERRRKTDKLRIFVHSKDECDNDKDPYFVELNSVDGKLQLHTGTENGESHSYDIIVDTKSSTITLTDDNGNTIGISTEDKLISLENESGSYVKIEDKDISCNCDGDFSIDCDNFKVKAKTAINEEGTSKVETKGGKVSISSDSTMEMKCTMMDATVNSMTKYTSPTFLVSGLLGAPTVGMSPAPGSPPAIQQGNSAMNCLSASPQGLAAYGDKTMQLFLSIIPCFGPLAGVAAGIISPMAPQIPTKLVKI